MNRTAEIGFVKELLRNLDNGLQAIKKLPPSAENTLSMRRLQEAIMWLDMDLKRLYEADPYSKDPSTGDLIEPTADGLKF